MAVPAATFTVFDAIGNREDLADIIYNISPTECPFMMSAGRGSATAVKHEWQVDSLAAHAHNAAAEGDEPSTLAATTATSRIFNMTQISTKTLTVSGTQEVVDKAGRKSELAYQLAKRAKELKRDMEASALGIVDAGIAADQVAPGLDAAAEGTARRVCPVEQWIHTNIDEASDATSYTFSADQWTNNELAAADGTARALTESTFKDIIRQCWNEGGEPNMVITGPKNKQNISQFAGNSTRFDRGEDKRLVASVDYYVSDFGEHQVVPNRFSRDRTVFILTTSLWSMDYLRGFRQFPLAKLGDTERRELLAEWTVRSSQQKGSGIIKDLTVT